MNFILASGAAWVEPPGASDSAGVDLAEPVSPFVETVCARTIGTACDAADEDDDPVAGGWDATPAPAVAWAGVVGGAGVAVGVGSAEVLLAGGVDEEPWAAAAAATSAARGRATFLGGADMAAEPSRAVTSLSFHAQANGSDEMKVNEVDVGR